MSQGTDFVVTVDNETFYDIEFVVDLDAKKTKNIGANQTLPFVQLIGPQLTGQTLGVKFSPKNSAQDASISLEAKWFFGNPAATQATGTLYKLPFQKGKQFTLAQGFNGAQATGNKAAPTHTGRSAFSVDFEMPTGTLICAARDGTVAEIKDSAGVGGATAKLDSWNFVTIRHSDGTYGTYGHLKQNGVSSHVKVGQQVNAGDVIGESDNSGRTTGPHLHFQVQKAVAGRAQASGNNVDVWDTINWSFDDPAKPGQALALVPGQTVSNP